jgi:hypothetical protein
MLTDGTDSDRIAKATAGKGEVPQPRRARRAGEIQWPPAGRIPWPPSIRRHPDTPLLRRAWELRDTCTTYGGLYVALGEAFPATLITRDGRLARGAAGVIDIVLGG